MREWSTQATNTPTTPTMTDLLKALKEFKAAYKGDPEGLESDFQLVAGHSIQELTDLLMDEVNLLNSFED